MRRCAFVLSVAFLSGSTGCNDDRPTALPSASPTPTIPGATPGRATGPSAIVLLAANPPVGSTIGECGDAVAGCSGRIRMSFRVTSTGNGTVLGYLGFLHATDKTACLQGRAPGGSLRTGEAQTVEIVFDKPDTSGRCRTPLDIRDLAFNAEGTVEVASRQEWALGYRLLP